MKIVNIVGVLIFFISGCMIWIAMDLQVGGVLNFSLSRIILSILSKFLLLSVFLIAIPVATKLIKILSEQPKAASVADYLINPFKEHLDLNETTLWLGKPSRLGLASTGWQPILLYLGFPNAMTFIVLGYQYREATPSVKMALLCLFVMSALTIYGLCLLAITDRSHKTYQNHYYAITNQRLWKAVLVNNTVTSCSCLNIQDLDIANIEASINSRKGLGTIRCRSRMSGKEICFERIDDADKVTAIIDIAYNEYHKSMTTG